MSNPADRRRAERFPVNAASACPFLSPVVENFGPVKIKNVSTEGIGLLVGRRVEPGSLLAVTLTNQSRNFKKTLLLRVAHVTAEHGAFLVGASFLEPLTYEELTVFVM